MENKMNTQKCICGHEKYQHRVGTFKSRDDCMECKCEKFEVDSQVENSEKSSSGLPDTFSSIIADRKQRLLDTTDSTMILCETAYIVAIKKAQKLVEDAITNKMLKGWNVIHDVDDCECCENVHKQGWELKKELGLT